MIHTGLLLHNKQTRWLQPVKKALDKAGPCSESVSDVEQTKDTQQLIFTVTTTYGPELWIVTKILRSQVGYKQLKWVSSAECLGSALKSGWGALTFSGSMEQRRCSFMLSWFRCLVRILLTDSYWRFYRNVQQVGDSEVQMLERLSISACLRAPQDKLKNITEERDVWTNCA